jgi:hypothetical protein
MAAARSGRGMPRPSISRIPLSSGSLQMMRNICRYQIVVRICLAADLKEPTNPASRNRFRGGSSAYAWTGEPRLTHISAQRRHAVAHSFAMLPWDALSQAVAQALHNSAHNLRI